ncbi:MAG: hypothetical protein NkDv07_0283 [Candidatus Improbicoccus devescovinae]|nr:MAG: hypothetical protein NkDv07_0283 [Candidatus Improbicoccus devescovinae]
MRNTKIYQKILAIILLVGIFLLLRNKKIYQKILAIILLVGIFLLHGSKRIAASAPPSTQPPPPTDLAGMFFRTSGRALAECGFALKQNTDLPVEDTDVSTPPSEGSAGPQIDTQDGLVVIASRRTADIGDKHQRVGTLYGAYRATVKVIQEFVSSALDDVAAGGEKIQTLVVELRDRGALTVFYDAHSATDWPPDSACILISSVVDNPEIPPYCMMQQSCSLHKKVV